MRDFVRAEWIAVMYLVPPVVFFPPHETWLHSMWNIVGDVDEV
jgi:hypothetical protein